MGDYHPGTDAGGQIRDAHQGFPRLQPPDAAAQRRVQRGYRQAVSIHQVLQVALLVGIPPLVHHHLHAVEADLGGPGEDAIQPERMQRSGAEDDGYAGATPALHAGPP